MFSVKIYNALSVLTADIEIYELNIERTARSLNAQMQLLIIKITGLLSALKAVISAVLVLYLK